MKSKHPRDNDEATDQPASKKSKSKGKQRAHFEADGYEHVRTLSKRVRGESRDLETRTD